MPVCVSQVFLAIICFLCLDPACGTAVQKDKSRYLIMPCWRTLGFEACLARGPHLLQPASDRHGGGHANARVEAKYDEESWVERTKMVR